jgi:hypothetical protein
VQDNDLGVKYMLLAISLKSKTSSEALQSEGDAHACQPRAAAYPFVAVVTNSFSSHDLTSTHVPKRSYEMVVSDAQQREISACSRYALIPFDALALDDQTIYFPDKTKSSHAIYHSQFTFREKSSAYHEFIFIWRFISIQRHLSATS